MSAWMFMGYAARQVEKGEWTQEYAAKLIEDIIRIDLEQDEFDRKMVEEWRKLKKSKN